jgi:acyl-coenzyme A synthetase/AMP-(fatty) acid ligase
MFTLKAIQHQVLDRPDNLAVVTSSGCLTYAELWARAESASRSLSGAQGMGVALQLPNSAEFLIWLLGTWMAGGVAIPVDVEAPSGVVAGIRRKTKPRYWITESVVSLEDAALLPDLQLANIYYTSGSTGTPKAVMQSDQGIAHFAQLFAKTLGIQPGTKVSWLYSPAFSATMMDVLGTLMNGACIYAFDLRKHGVHHGAQWLRTVQLNILHTVPSVFRTWVNFPNAQAMFTSLHAVDLGGEPVRELEVRQWKKVKPERASLFNHLAATEASVIAMESIETVEDLEAGWSAPFLQLDLVEFKGRKGRIRLNSPFLSPGYLNPTKAQSACFSEPSEDGSWSFISEDLGMWKQGQLVVTGRVNRRVKLNGLALDLDEIESHLRTLPIINDVAIVLHKGSKPQLVGWIATSDSDAIAACQSHLANHVPAHAIPSHWELLDALPLNSNGKRNLPVLEARALNHDTGACSQSFNRYEALVGIWFKKEIERFSGTLSADTHFFEAGGDSLAWGSLHARFEQSCGKTVALADLLAEPTLGGIARLLKTMHQGLVSEQAERVVITLREGAAGLPLFLVHGGQGEAFVSPAFLSMIAADRPVHAFRGIGFDLAQINGFNNISDWAAEYVRHMQQIQPTGPYSIAALCIGYTLAISIADQLTELGEQVLPIALFDPPFKVKKTWRERYVFWKRRKLFRWFGKQVIASRDTGFQNGLNATPNPNEFTQRQAKEDAFYALYPTFNATLNCHRGIRFQASSTMTSLPHPSMRHMSVVVVGTNHSEVLDVGNVAFQSAWQEFETEVLGEARLSADLRIVRTNSCSAEHTMDDAHNPLNE